MNRSFSITGSGVLRLLIAAFAVLTCLRVWTNPQPILPQALAQIPDSGLQRKLLIEEAQKTNQLLSEIKQILSERNLNVRIVGADNPADRR